MSIIDHIHDKTLVRLAARADELGLATIEELIHHYGQLRSARQMNLECGIAWETAQRLLRKMGYQTSQTWWDRSKVGEVARAKHWSKNPERCEEVRRSVREKARARGPHVWPEGVPFATYAEQFGAKVHDTLYTRLYAKLRREGRLISREEYDKRIAAH